MKLEKIANDLMEKIKKLEADRTTLHCSFNLRDESVQAELRLSSGWSLHRPVDQIQFPKNLTPAPYYRSRCSDGTMRDDNGQIVDDPAGDLWREMQRHADAIRTVAHIKTGKNAGTIKINDRKKTGPAERAEAKNQFIIASCRQFLADYKVAAAKSNIKKIDQQIAALQAQQKALLPALRKSNSEFCAARKNAKTEQGKKNAAALISGRFWEADETAIKGYFHPPFDKNYLADVSEKWRAALFLECESISYKNYSGDWRHKLGGTGRGYLCGIDDNGDEWGFIVRNLPQSSDNYGNSALDNTVEEAMAEVFQINKCDLAKCTRQGDLLFCTAEIRKEDSPEHCAHCGKPMDQHVTVKINMGPRWEDNVDMWMDTIRCFDSEYADEYRPRIIKAPVLKTADQWEPRTGHILASTSLKHNGVYFCAANEITVTHTSHASLMLPAGEYRLYMSRMADDKD